MPKIFQNWHEGILHDYFEKSDDVVLNINDKLICI